MHERTRIEVEQGVILPPRVVLCDQDGPCDLTDALSVWSCVESGGVVVRERARVVVPEQGACLRPEIDTSAPVGTTYRMEYTVEWPKGLFETLPSVGPLEFVIVPEGESMQPIREVRVPEPPRKVRYAWA